MEQFHLIIQKTTTGLNIEYSSPGIDPEHPNVKNTIEDERAYATQIVRESDVYSLEITKHYRIYSLIVIDSDKFGRSGYYEIKLYGPRDYSLETFVEILQTIKLKYNEESGNKSYDSILSAIVITPNNREDHFIPKKSNKTKYYSFYDENNLDSLKETFSDKGVMLISKLYALNRSKAYDENIIESVGLKPFSNAQFREVVLSNPHRVLKDLYLNNETLEIDTFKNEFKLVVRPTDVLTYSTSDSKTIKTIQGSSVEIKRKPPVYTPVPTNYPRTKKKSFFKETGVYLLALVIILGGVGFSIYSYPAFFGLNFQKQSSNITTVKENEVLQSSISPLFCDYSSKDSLHFVPIREGLDHYIFSFADSTWFYRNKEGKDVYNPLSREIVKDLQIKDSIPFNPEDQRNFIAALEKESGKKIDSTLAKVPTIVTKKPKKTEPKNTKPQKKVINEQEELEKPEEPEKTKKPEVKIDIGVDN